MPEDEEAKEETALAEGPEGEGIGEAGGETRRGRGADDLLPNIYEANNP